MDNQIIELLKYLSAEALIIAIISFVLTMLIKYPIKKLTSKLIEEKRKAVNIVILFIPALLSFILSLLYFGVLKSDWRAFVIIDTALSGWLISLTIYAVYERIVIIIKAVKNGKTEINGELASETINFIKSNIETLTTTLKEKENKLEAISSKLKTLNQVKENIISDTSAEKDISKLSETNIEIQTLVNEETSLQNQILTTKNQIENYTKQLYIKQGE